MANYTASASHGLASVIRRFSSAKCRLCFRFRNGVFSREHGIDNFALGNAGNVATMTFEHYRKWQRDLMKIAPL
jgi:hypothetical protein